MSDPRQSFEQARKMFTDSNQGGILIQTIDDVGPALAFIRNLAAISQREVARRARVSNKAMVGDWEVGNRRPSVRNLLTTINVLGYEVVLRPQADEDVL